MLLLLLCFSLNHQRLKYFFYWSLLWLIAPNYPCSEHSSHHKGNVENKLSYLQDEGPFWCFANEYFHLFQRTRSRSYVLIVALFAPELSHARFHIVRRNTFAQVSERPQDQPWTILCDVLKSIASGIKLTSEIVNELKFRSL